MFTVRHSCVSWSPILRHSAASSGHPAPRPQSHRRLITWTMESACLLSTLMLPWGHRITNLHRYKKKLICLLSLYVTLSKWVCLIVAECFNLWERKILRFSQSMTTNLFLTLPTLGDLFHEATILPTKLIFWPRFDLFHHFQSIPWDHMKFISIPPSSYTLSMTSIHCWPLPPAGLWERATHSYGWDWMHVANLNWRFKGQSCQWAAHTGMTV